MKVLFQIALVALVVVSAGLKGYANDFIPPVDSIPADKKGDGLPVVFLIGDNPELFEALSRRYKTPLIEACDEDMNLAFKKWMKLMIDIEAFAEENEFEINGTRMWIKFFWASDGTIDFIAYHLKPNSRNIDIKSLTTFFESYLLNNKFPISYKNRYSHYASASFPTFYKRALNE